MFLKFTSHADQARDKLADVELVFEYGVLAGMTLVGFAVWRNRHNTGLRVTFPSRQMMVHGERRRYALLRPFNTHVSGDALRRLIAEAYSEHERQKARAGDLLQQMEHVRDTHREGGSAPRSRPLRDGEPV